MEDYGKINELYATFWKDPYPARSAIGVQSLPKGGKVEIEIIAAY